MKKPWRIILIVLLVVTVAFCALFAATDIFLRLSIGATLFEVIEDFTDPWTTEADFEGYKEDFVTVADFLYNHNIKTDTVIGFGTENTFRVQQYATGYDEEFNCPEEVCDAFWRIQLEASHNDAPLNGMRIYDGEVWFSCFEYYNYHIIYSPNGKPDSHKFKHIQRIEKGWYQAIIDTD